MLGHHRRRAIRAFIVTLRPWILGLLGVLALGYLQYFLATLGPRPPKSTPSAARAVDDPDVRRLAALAAESEQSWRKALVELRSEAEVAAALAVAIDRHRAWVAASPRVGSLGRTKLAQLESEQATQQAAQTGAVIERLEREAGLAAAADREAVAQSLYEEALRLQRAINRSEAAPRGKNYVRESALVAALDALGVAPLHREVVAAMEAARLAISERRWGDALVAYQLAHDGQRRINREAPRTRFADAAAVERLEAEMAALEAGDLFSEVEAQENAGEAALAGGDFLNAERALARAHLAQAEINRRFTRSRFVSIERLDQLEIKRQTAASLPGMARLRALDGIIRTHLRARQIVAAEPAITEASALAEAVFTDYPRSQRLDPSLRIRLSFLALRRSELRRLQDDVYDRLLPLPTASERLLLRTETPQGLYALVMNTNPSRNPGRQLPVDSVTWAEAEGFCTRLSWLLGTVVRLPTADEHRIAAADGGAGAWSAENGGGRSHEIGQLAPNALGFFDLAGNVAEWLAGDQATTAWVAGGSYLDPTDVIARPMIIGREKAERARHVGFRVLVDLGSPSEGGATP